MATYQEQLDRARKQREEREKAEAERKAAQLSPEQVMNWRRVLANMGIPFAMSMPESMVQQFRDGIQARVLAEHKPDDAASQGSAKENK